MPTFPLPTIACTVTPTGISAPPIEDILQSLIASYQAIFGSDVVLTPDTQDYQNLAIRAAAQNDSNNATIAAYNTFNPAASLGAGQDSTYKINGIRRESATYSTIPAEIVGPAGTVINFGIVQDQNGNLWDLPNPVEIPDSGTITVTATAEQLGDISATAGAATFYTKVLGSPTVTFTADATPGAPVESNGAFRQRQTISTSLTSITPLQAIAAALANLVGVERSIVYENQGVTPDGNGVPGHSICAVVQGGDSTAIAQTIEQTKAPGTGTGNGMPGITTIGIFDPSGVPVNISFYELALTGIYVSLSITPLQGYVSSTGDAIVAAIVAFINSLGIGDTVYYNWLFGPASLYGSGLEFTFKISALTIGLAPAPVGVADIPVAFNAAAATSTPNVVLTVL